MKHEVTLRNEEERGLIAEIQSVWADYSQPVIRDNAAHQFAANSRKALKDYAKRLEEVKKGHTRPIDELKASVLAYFNEIEDVLKAAQKRIDVAMLEYLDFQDQVRRAEQAKLEAAAKQREAEAKAELEAAALKAIKEGKEEQAQALVERAEEVRVGAPVLPVVAPKAQGAAYREIWKFEVVDLDKLPRAYMMPNDSMIGAAVRSMKDKAAIPGVRIWAEKIISGTK